MIDLLARRREMMGASEAPRQYVDIFSSTFPQSGLVNNRNSIIFYITEHQPIGTNIHISYNAPDLPSSVQSLIISVTSTAGGEQVKLVSPLDSVDVEFELARASNSYFSLIFSENLTNVQFSNIKVEKII